MNVGDGSFLSGHFKDGKQELQRLPLIAKLSERVTTVLGMNPGPYTLQGTNCYLVGSGERRLLVDTGEGSWEFHENLLKVLRNCQCRLAGVLLTHSHADHLGGLPQLLREWPELEVWRFQPHGGAQFRRLGTGEDASDPALTFGACAGARFRSLIDGDVITAASGATLRAIHTPGHANDHLCFWLEEEQALFTGDHILGVGTVIVDDLEAYMASLQRLEGCAPRRIYPGHGPMLDGAAATRRPTEYLDHRRSRLEAAAALLAQQPRGWSLQQLLHAVYGAKLPSDSFLRHAARRNLEASLQKLEKDSRARRISSDLWRSCSPGNAFVQQVGKEAEFLQHAQAPKIAPPMEDEGDLRGILQKARPGWGPRDLAAAEVKLKKIGLHKPVALAEILSHSGGAVLLNEKLRASGLRTFTAETVSALEEVLVAF